MDAITMPIRAPGALRVTLGGVKLIEKAPALQDIEVSANGVYSADDAHDGLGRVTVSVPETIPALQDIEVSANGVYEADDAHDGLGRVSVDVPPSGEPIASAVLPAPDAALAGKIYLYTGEATDSLTPGNYYLCAEVEA